MDKLQKKVFPFIPIGTSLIAFTLIVSSSPIIEWITMITGVGINIVALSLLLHNQKKKRGITSL
ncbi:hypothetical protein [Bacillus sp. CECT 9360]|uniref:hypothetical protein n=1 Tax=Bacillus sp. CECT 9360 TaxID=2845821 RepID=UPI001E60B94A|nr:hypothetical protein [Bacillus sp. CECT 9360]CAH0347693.1 hypothetical protein BCI9360_04114 [Bacillus sp. CECT 9360]